MEKLLSLASRRRLRAGSRRCWSAIDQGELPAPLVFGHWHTDGFVGIVATASEILSVDDMASEIVELFDEAFAHCRGKP